MNIYMKNLTTALTVLMLALAMAGGVYMYMRSQTLKVQNQQVSLEASAEPTEAVVTETVATPTPEALIGTAGEIEIPLETIEKSGVEQSGTAILKEESGKVIVSIEVNHPIEVTDPQPIHIHKGACPGVGAIAYPLTSLQDGVSETVLDVTLEDIKKQLPLAINIHKSLKEATVYTACGNIQ